MAFDTRDLRAGAQGFCLWPLHPNPDGAPFSQADRQMVIGVYLGILASAPGAVYEIAGVAAAFSGASGRLIRGGVALGLEESVKSEFLFPNLPSNASPELRDFLIELRCLLERLNIGDAYRGGHVYVDGQAVADKIVASEIIERHS